MRKKNKWLLKIHTWIKEHGGGVMIPFSAGAAVQALTLALESPRFQNFDCENDNSAFQFEPCLVFSELAPLHQG